MLNIQQNIMLSEYTTFRIGGPAKFFVEVESEEELIEALKYAKENGLEFFILGGGSNLLVSDKGFNGMVIKNQITNYKLQITESAIEANAGAPLALIVNLATQNSLTGMEWAAGIPGTVGGAVRGNAGAFGGSMSDIIESVRALEISNFQIPPKYNKLTMGQAISNKIPNPKLPITNCQLRDCQFGYRTSIFKQNKNLVILSAKIKLQPGNKKESQKKIQEIIGKRIAKQPEGMGSAGSYFANPVVKNEKLREEFEHDCGIKCKNEKLPAGWLIDQAGLRGKKIGGAMVSEKHANFIINTGAATAEDVIMLASLIKQQVRDKFGIELESEVQYLGF